LAAQPVQLQKFLVSATLTRDPQKLAALRLSHPVHFSLRPAPSAGRGGGGGNNDQGDKRYALPPNLKEYAIECTAEQRPLVLVALLLERLQQQQQQQRQLGSSSEKAPHPEKIVIFTSSVDSTHRLARLLQLLWAAGVAKLLASDPSSSATDEARAVAEVSSSASALSAQERFSRLQSRSIVVCSDGLSRGMDLPRVSLVVHYDVPRLAKSYVHRCGRTARAGRPGTAVVLLKRGQRPAFDRMRSLIVQDTTASSGADDSAQRASRGPGVEAMAIPKPGLLRDAIPLYRNCLAGLRRVLVAEERGELGRMDEDRLHHYLADDGE
jgi:ATP-dependent RNA helicase DDX51/DBP6